MVWMSALLGRLGGLLAFGQIGTVVSALLNFFASPVGKWVAIALLGLGLYVAGDLHRLRLDRAAWVAREQAAEEARQARDAQIKKQVAADADERIARIQRESDELKAKVNAYEAELAKRSKNPACVLTPDDVRRLRHL
jgi:type VI protein secretion system component VasK